jgi:hypothetical protein
MCFCPALNPKEVGPRLGCPQLHIQHIRGKPPSLEAVFLPELTDSPCRDDKRPTKQKCLQVGHFYD